MTGSDKTFEEIIFGHTITNAERQDRIEPVISKRFTSELGNVSPVIIVPGPWSERDIREQARRRTGMRLAFCLSLPQR